MVEESKAPADSSVDEKYCRVGDTGLVWDGLPSYVLGAVGKIKPARQVRRIVQHSWISTSCTDHAPKYAIEVREA